MGVPRNTAIAAQFHDNATRHLANLDEQMERLARRAEPGDQDSQAALVVLRQIRKDLVADIGWSEQYLRPSAGTIRQCVAANTYEFALYVSPKPDNPRYGREWGRELIIFVNEETRVTGEAVVRQLVDQLRYDITSQVEVRSVHIASLPPTHPARWEVERARADGSLLVFGPPDPD